MYHGSIAPSWRSVTHWCSAFSHLTNGAAVAHGTVDDSTRGRVGHGGPRGKQGIVGHRETLASMSQVAITMVYRYRPRGRAPLDAGVVVADNGEIDGYRY